jgi:hypothetical protein
MEDMSHTVHIGLVKDGRRKERVIVQVARSIDQLSCEAWKYLGERYTTVARLKRQQNELLQAINKQFNPTPLFTRIAVQAVADGDWTAGHVPAQDVREYLAAGKHA